MIRPASSSYPVMGAALDARVSPRIAYGWLERNRQYFTDSSHVNLRRLTHFHAAAQRRAGVVPMRRLMFLLEAAISDGRIYAPWAEISPYYVPVATNLQRLQFIGVDLSSEPDLAVTCEVDSSGALLKVTRHD